MKTFYLEYPKDFESISLEDSVAAIGFFDGVHKGHQTLVNEALKFSKRHFLKSAVITFHPHPSVVLSKSKTDIDYITPLSEKETIFEEMGIDYLIIIKFNDPLSKLLPDEFIQAFIVKLNIKHLIAGFDFSFGYKGQGNMMNLNEYMSDEFTYQVIDEVSNQGEKISSTRIRENLKIGNIKLVNQLLGRPYSFKGLVMDGDKRGRTIGFPTANLEPTTSYLLPKQGVYAVRVKVAGVFYYGMANLGYVPTFKLERKEPKVEVYIFDFDKNIYGEIIEVQWLDYIREEKKFSGIEEIKQQLKADEEEIKKRIGISK